MVKSRRNGRRLTNEWTNQRLPFIEISMRDAHTRSRAIAINDNAPGSPEVTTLTQGCPGFKCVGRATQLNANSSCKSR